MSKASSTDNFMPLSNTPCYGPPMDIFSFARIILHTFNQQWPRSIESIFKSKTRKMLALSEVDQWQKYLDGMTGEAEVLRPLVEVFEL